MNEIKVLGASQRNVGAINRVLNSPVFTLTQGHVSPDIKFKDEEEQTEIELPSGICLLVAINGVLSGIQLPISGGVFSVFTNPEGDYEPDDPRYYEITWKPIRYC